MVHCESGCRCLGAANQRRELTNSEKMEWGGRMLGVGDGGVNPSRP